ncbi:MAG: hypothetical protein ABWK04_09010 [Hydrogenobacter sp.]
MRDLISYSLTDVDASALEILRDRQWGGRQVRNSHNALELARLYPVWYLSYLSRFLVFENLRKVIYSLPKMRYFRRSYYSFVKYVDLPSLNWVLITLTFSRSISLQDVYANLGSWVSAFLKRFREYLRKVKGFRNFIYLWVVEIHDDGYPHVHVLSTFPFVDINRIYSWWRDSCGNSLSAFQGIDVKFIGRNVQKVKNKASFYKKMSI